ncbi:glycosyltransferase family 2 protein [Anaeromyxobacter oryzisoli]|uniref:glycosyltransferase family 2 protein n=1 Tax=Anaeromyxobacter oryzisoli TaxID=2925408 RepID=UPI001F577473|nr:glycosyltransferase family A protein [Anaeromyxobacter sp. SG63]
MPVSIGIPFLNPGSVFEKAIRSVFAQTYSDWELILVNDGSTDGSLERARAIADPRVTVVSDGENRGLCARLNQIAALARHELLCRMDADDVMHPERLRRQVDWMLAHPEVDVLGSRAVGVDEDDAPTCMLGRPFDEGGEERAALVRTLFVHTSVIGRRAWFRANPYDAAFVRAEDHELWLRAAPTSRYALLDEPLVFYRQPDRLNLRAYVATCRTDREVYRRYGARAGGAAVTAALLARSYAFEAIHRTAAALHLTAPLMRLRGAGLPADSVARHQAAIARALRAKVPGWPQATTSVARVEPTAVCG